MDKKQDMSIDTVADLTVDATEDIFTFFAEFNLEPSSIANFLTNIGFRNLPDDNNVYDVARTLLNNGLNDSSKIADFDPSIVFMEDGFQQLYMTFMLGILLPQARSYAILRLEEIQKTSGNMEDYSNPYELLIENVQKVLGLQEEK